MKLTKSQKERLEVAVVAGVQRSILFSSILKQSKKPLSKIEIIRIQVNIKKISNDKILRVANSEKDRKKVINNILR